MIYETTQTHFNNRSFFFFFSTHSLPCSVPFLFMQPPWCFGLNKQFTFFCSFFLGCLGAGRIQYRWKTCNKTVYLEWSKHRKPLPSSSRHLSALMTPRPAPFLAQFWLFKKKRKKKTNHFIKTICICLMLKACTKSNVSGMLSLKYRV